MKLLQKLLPERLQAETDAARQVVSYCGRLPLALRIAAAMLAIRSWQGKRLADYAQQLANERQRLDRLKLENLKLPSNSLEHATVTQWLQDVTQPCLQDVSQPRRPAWFSWLLPPSVLLFCAWNLINGHRLIALLGVLALISWQGLYRKR